MDIDVILERKSRVLKEERMAKVRDVSIFRTFFGRGGVFTGGGRRGVCVCRRHSLGLLFAHLTFRTDCFLFFLFVVLALVFVLSPSFY